MADNFDAIIIGTGFGATVALSALRGKGKRVLMLERGLWFFTPERPVPSYITKTNAPKSTQRKRMLTKKKKRVKKVRLFPQL